MTSLKNRIITNVATHSTAALPTPASTLPVLIACSVCSSSAATAAAAAAVMSALLLLLPLLVTAASADLTLS
jgi:hypothetical protein